jgi:hypothetical protein
VRDVGGQGRAERREGGAHARLDGAERDSERLGRLRVAETSEVRGFDRPALSFRQPVYDGGEPIGLFGALNGARGVGPRVFAKVGGFGRDRAAPEAKARAHEIDRAAAGEAEEPRFGAAAGGIVGGGDAPNLFVDVDQRLFGEAAIADGAKQDAERASSRRVVESAEGFGVARRRAGEEACGVGVEGSLRIRR